eukprot:TRINITY_DN3040_c0_g1_i8.p1 TRINITY_DN3040_c0_g1~~TRINITY_DN3040_c0_g1_i8.p1  ORF type:complete len:199 (+),score=59.79 TRINITY_DN3040_c0_g1_i8:1-597(+)
MYIRDRDVEHSLETHQSFKIFDFFFSSRRRHTRFLPVSWARRCVQETGYQRRVHGETTPDNKHFVTSTSLNQAKIWNLQTFEAIRVLQVHQESIRSIITTSDMKFLITGSMHYDETITIWNFQTGEQVYAFENGESAQVHNMALTFDNWFLITHSNRHFKIWNLKTKTLEFDLQSQATNSFEAIAISPNSQYLSLIHI